MTNKKFDDFEHELACFEEYLFRDLDGWFCAEIACCDHCHDDFINVWPHAYNAESAVFQTNQIDIEVFYEGSHLQETFTKARFFELMQYFPCPWCGAKTTNNLYPYELPFEVLPNFKRHMAEIQVLASRTPFLLLEHPFAESVLQKLKAISAKTPRTSFDYLYRGRGKEKLESRDNREFYFPPSQFVGEGRYNHAGSPALYLGSSPNTCFYELREQSCAVAKIAIHRELKLLSLVDTWDADTGEDDFLNTLSYSALLSAPRDQGGEDKPQYVFSRFLADCAKSSGFDGIKYFSTRPGVESFNVVLFPDSFKSGSDFEVVSTTDINPLSNSV